MVSRPVCIGVRAAVLLALLAGSARAQQPMTLEPAWDEVFGTGQEVMTTLVDHELVGTSLYLAVVRTGGAGFTVRRLDVSTGAVAWNVAYSTDGVFSEQLRDLAAAPDGSEAFALSSPDFRITRFRGTDGAADVLDTVPALVGDRLALTPSGDRLVAAGDGLVVVYDTVSGARSWTASVATSVVQDLVVDEQRVFILVSGRVTALDLDDGAVAWSIDFPDVAPTSLEKAPGDGLLVVAGGGLLASSGGSRGLAPATGEVVWSVDLTGFKSTSIAPDGSKVLSSNIQTAFLNPQPESTLGALDVQTGQVAWSVPLANGSHPFAVPAVSPDSRLVAYPLSPGMAHLYDSASGAFVGEVSFDPGGTLAIEAVAFGPQSAELLVFGRQELDPAGLIRPIVLATDLDGVELWRHVVKAEGSAPDVLLDAALSPDGERWFTGGETGVDSRFALQALRAATGTSLWKVEDAGRPAAERLVASNQALFVIAGEELRAHAASDGAELWSREKERARDLAVSADGTSLFDVLLVPNGPGNFDFAVRKLDAATGAERWSVTFDGVGANDRPGSIALSPDGETVFVGAQKRLPVPPNGHVLAHVTTLALDEESGAVRWEVTSFEGSSWNGSDVVVSPDGARVFVLGANELASITSSRFYAYDAASGAELWRTPIFGTLGNSTKPPVAFALSADGSRLVGAGYGTNAFNNVFTPVWRALSVDAATGAILWDRELTVDHFNPTLDVLVTSVAPTVVVCGQPSSTLFLGLDLATGDVLWSAPSIPLGIAGGVALAEIPSGDRLLVAHSQSGDFRAAAFDLPTLVSSPSPLSLAVGGERELRLRAGGGHGGAFYWILGSATGVGDGLPLPNGSTLPLVPDDYFALTLQPGLPFFDGFLGALSGAGEGHGALLVPSGTDPSLAGLELTHAAIAFGASGRIEHVTNPVTLTLQP